MEKQEKQELDLIDIILSIYKFIVFIFVKIKDFFIWLLQSMYSGKWILLVFILLGALFSLYQSRPENLNYKGEVEMRVNFQDIYLYKEMINMLNQYCLDTTRTSLAHSLDIEVEEAKRVASINSHFFVDMQRNGTPDKVDYADKFDPKDSINTLMRDRLMIVILAKDTAIYSLLLNKLNVFFNSNPTVQKENIIRLKQIDEKIDHMNYEIHILDSLRKIEYFRKQNNESAKIDKTILLNEKDRKLYHNDILGLEASKQALQWEKETRPENIRFVTKFKIEPKPINRITKTLVKFVPIFFLLGVFFVIGWQSRKKVFEIISNQKTSN